MSSLKFEWDEQKNIRNQKKHQVVSFKEAESVFADEFARLIPDPDHSEGEERFIIRVISARKADKFERRQLDLSWA